MRTMIAALVLGVLGGCATTPQEIRALDPVMTRDTTSQPPQAAACIERTAQDLGFQAAVRASSSGTTEALITLPQIGMRVVIDIAAILGGSRMTAYVSNDLFPRTSMAEKTLGNC